jgi:hypothetical protein
LLRGQWMGMHSLTVKVVTMCGGYIVAYISIAVYLNVLALFGVVKGG